MSTKQITEIAFAAGALGALLIAIGALILVVANRSYEGPSEVDHRREKWLNLLGALFIGGAFVGQLFAVLKK